MYFIVPGQSTIVRMHQVINKSCVSDIKMPAQPYTSRGSTLSTTQRMDFKYMSPTNLRRSPVPSSGSVSPSRVIPISVVGRARHQSPASRRDMISFNKARAAASTTTITTENKLIGQKGSQMYQNLRETVAEEKTAKPKQVPQESQITTTAKSKSVRVVSPPMTSISVKTETQSKKQMSDIKQANSAHDEFRQGKDESTIGPSEKKILDSVSVEEIIEKVIKPAGLEAKVSSSGDSKVRYHVETTEQEDGTTKTQIVLESKVEEELNISEDSALDELLNQGVKKVSLEDIDNTATGSMIKNLISSLQGGEKLLNKSVNVEIIEEPIETHSDEEFEVEQKSRSSFYGSSTHFQIEELENAPHDSQEERSGDGAMKSTLRGTDLSSHGYVQVQEVSRERGSPPFSHDQDLHEYFVSTPDDNLSESEEGGGITSYGHFGIVDDLSDEKYYQDESLPQKRVIVEEADEYGTNLSSLVKESFPECIIEEEVRVSPVVQESMLEYLREGSLEPKQQLRGALEKLQGSVSGPLKEELAFLTKVSGESRQNVAVKKVEQSSDKGTTTIVAELNVSQTLEDSGLLEAEDDLSEEQIMAALRSSNVELGKAFMGGAGGVQSIRVFKEDDNDDDDEGFEGVSKEGKSAREIVERHIKLGPAEKSFTWQMDVQGSYGEASSEQEGSGMMSSEKRFATVYLESPSED